MLIEIKWQDIASRTIYCQIEGEWSYSGYNHTYMQLIQYARQVSGKINLILDINNAIHLVEDAKLLRVSPFIEHAVIVSHKPDNPVIQQMQRVLQAQHAGIVLSHTTDVEHATAAIRRGVSIRA